jgi:hypothetical protein
MARICLSNGNLRIVSIESPSGILKDDVKLMYRRHEINQSPKEEKVTYFRPCGRDFSGRDDGGNGFIRDRNS